MIEADTGLRAVRARLRRAVCIQIRDGIAYLSALRLVIVGERDGDLQAFDWPGLQCDLQRLGSLDRHLGPVEQRPLTEQQCDSICKAAAASQ